MPFIHDSIKNNNFLKFNQTNFREYSSSIFDTLLSANDFPTPEFMVASTVKDVSKLLLNPAIKLVDEIAYYITHQESIKHVDVSVETPPDIQYFIHQSKKHLLIEKNHLDYIYNLMINYNYDQMWDKALQKNPNLFFNLLSENNKANAKQPWSCTVLKLLDSEQILESISFIDVSLSSFI